MNHLTLSLTMMRLGQLRCGSRNLLKTSNRITLKIQSKLDFLDNWTVCLHARTKTTSNRPLKGSLYEETKKKDRVSGDFELISSSDTIFQTFTTPTNILNNVISPGVVFFSLKSLLQDYASLSPFQNVFNLFDSEPAVMALNGLVAGTIIFIWLRIQINRLSLRLYINRETGEYLSVHQGVWKRFHNHFKAEDVTFHKTRNKFDFAHLKVKGKPFIVDMKDFRMIKDYHDMTKFAKRL